MLSHLQRCTLCLESTSSGKSISEKDAFGITISSKLQFIAPEVEWLSEFKICDACIDHLSAACKFKEKCLDVKNNKFHGTCNNLCDTLEVEYNSDISVDKEPSLEESKVFICFHCQKGCDSKDELIKHIDTEHVNKYEEDVSKYKRREICLQCGRKFVKTHSLQEHSAICDGVNRHMKIEVEKEHQCLKCKRYYTTDKILRTHEKRCFIKDFEKTDHQCTECNAFFKHLSTLRKHLKHGCRRNSNDSMFCKICDEPFKSQQKMNEHMREDHKKSSSFCDICRENFDTNEDYEFHKRNKHAKERFLKKRIFICEICNDTFNLVKDIIDHYINIHSMEEKQVKPYCCDICSKRFRSSTNLMNHKLYHDRNRTNICSICGKSFITKNDLLSHEMIHFNQRNYKCDKCEKAFKTSSNLRTHCLIVHSDPELWKFVCHVCGKRFPLKSNHDQHLRRHTGEKNFICTLCKKTFASKSELQEHVGYHSNVRCHRCDQCGREYRKKNTLDVHLTKAHGIGNAKIPIRERKHACHICPGRFHDRLKLARHLCTHSGLKPFSCYICEKKFTDKSYLRQHLKNTHSINEQQSNALSTSK
ncbi:uncharacterized protein [Leptinotarsa decemlineata]|uniref:uncharacterized protein n=1 Tax=Leptinotarsa decemlineata TaxID=7539 RepID=UPI000C251EC7|nr:zinc finger protein 600-like [Leptinotarsa decemlineata]